MILSEVKDDYTLSSAYDAGDDYSPNNIHELMWQQLGIGDVNAHVNGIQAI